MKSNAERLVLMHQKAQAMRRKRDRVSFSLNGSICAVLLISLFAVILRYQGLSPNASNNLYTASSLLPDGAGGYILVAVIAFMLGVVIAMLLKKQHDNKQKAEQDEDN